MVFRYEVMSNKIKNNYGLSQLVKSLKVYFVSPSRLSSQGSRIKRLGDSIHWDFGGKGLVGRA